MAMPVRYSDAKYQKKTSAILKTELTLVGRHIWQHTDDKNPSDEEDIVRVEDDFGR